VGGNENYCQGNNTLAQRNYPCDTHIEAYFGNRTSLDAVGKIPFQAQLYQCMIAQSLWMKGDLEERRSRNSFGLLIWQLNENWPTGGWGLVEYSNMAESSTIPGNMIGGRWKPLMHLLESSLFRDVFAACGRNNRCYVRNDGMEKVNVVVTLEAWSLKSSESLATFTYEAILPGGVSATGKCSIIHTLDLHLPTGSPWTI
jgi:beta-mannosidase